MVDRPMRVEWEHGGVTAYNKVIWAYIEHLEASREEAKKLVMEGLEAVGIFGDTPPSVLYLADGKKKLEEALMKLEE